MSNYTNKLSGGWNCTTDLKVMLPTTVFTAPLISGFVVWTIPYTTIYYELSDPAV